MPYHVRHVGDKYQVVKDSDGKIMGTHKTKQAAQKQIYAIHMNEKKK